jgi:hypothetical protein
MATIIAGRFEQQLEAQHMTEELLRAGFAREHIAAFYLNPAGQHATYRLGGDHDKSVGAKTSGRGIVAGVAAGAAAGVAATPILGPLGPVAGGLLGAYLGGLVGGLVQMKEQGDTGEHEEDPENALPVRHAGVYVAIAVDDDDGQKRAAEVLAALGASDVECAEGSIVNGDWIDFDPSVPPSQCHYFPRSDRGPAGSTQRA